MHRFITITRKEKEKSIQQLVLPEPDSSTNPAQILTVNKAVEIALVESMPKKRGPYGQHEDSFRAKVASYAIHHGDVSAIAKFSTKDKTLPESTVRTWRNQYLKEQKKQKSIEPLAKLPRLSKARPFLLGDFDHDIQNYITNLRKAGGIVNSSIAIAAAKGFISFKDRSLLQEFGGNIELKKSWAQSIMRRMNLVKRKGTKSARKLPVDFEQIQIDFFGRISEKIDNFQIPAELVVNWDQTGLNMVPVSEWTMEKEGEKQIPIFGLDDKRQITALLAISAAGDFLPPQLLYAGKTEQCHPVVKFPSDWDVWHSENHWSNEKTMIRYVEKVIIPYFEHRRESLNLEKNQKGLVIFDVFRAHQSESLIKLLRDSFIDVIFVPASCTSNLQPLDAEGCVNGALKRLMKDEFTNWYSEQLIKCLNDGQSIDTCKVDLRLSSIKPIHARWVLKAFENLSHDKPLIQNGWNKTGIADFMIFK